MPLPACLRGLDPRSRRALLWSIGDASLFSVMEGLSGGSLLLYAIAQGMPNLVVGFLLTFPLFAGSLSQLLSPALERLCGSRKGAVLAGGVLHALSWAAVPFTGHLTGSAQEAALLAVVCAGTVGWYLTLPSWSSWMGDLVPPRIRAAYFAWRAVLPQLFAFAGILVMGEWMTGRAAQGPGAFHALFLMAAGARALSLLCLFLQHEPPVGVFPEEAALPPASRPGDLRRVTVFFSAFHFSLFLVAPYFHSYMRAVHMDYRTIAWITAISFPAKILALPFWARAAGRLGHRWVILASGTLTALLPCLWVLSADWRYLLVVQVLNGFVWGGIELCEIPYLLQLTRPVERTRLLSGYFSIRSLCGCLGSTAGDGLILRNAWVQQLGVAGPYQAAMLASGAGRLLVGWWGKRRLP